MSYHGRFEQQKQPKNSGKQGKKGGKGLKIFLIVLAVLLALILIAAASAYVFIQNKFSKMNVITLPEDTYVYTEATDEYTRPPETSAVQTETTEEATVETTIPPMSADDIINILVVGQAARAGEESNMADTTMLISLNTYTKEGVINICYDPYASPKPRWLSNSFGNNIVSFGIDWGTKDNDTYAYSNTGYYCKKYWNGNFGLGQNTQHYHTDPIIRLAELYLNYAEAVNEAYGPYGSSSGLPYTAVQAVNLVRNRIGMPDVLSVYTGGKDSFRERIRNERCVELAFEGHHYYHDIRRWKIAEQTMGQVLYGMRIEKTPVSAGYPNGKKYTRTALPNNRQCLWKDYMYFLPFPDNEAYTMKNFENWTWQ